MDLGDGCGLDERSFAAAGGGGGHRAWLERRGGGARRDDQGRALHSLSGTMAISETMLKDVILMFFEEQNKQGGLLGTQLEAVVVDTASDWRSSPRKRAS